MMCCTCNDLMTNCGIVYIKITMRIYIKMNEKEEWSFACACKNIKTKKNYRKKCAFSNLSNAKDLNVNFHAINYFIKNFNNFVEVFGPNCMKSLMGSSEIGAQTYHWDKRRFLFLAIEKCLNMIIKLIKFRYRIVKSNSDTSKMNSRPITWYINY